MPRRVPDLSKAEAMIGYKPKYSLEDILTQVIAYFRQQS
jgi:nucleoside-diphosphate-sugar epimerase